MKEKFDKVICGLGNSGCIINGKAIIWGINGSKENLVFKIPQFV